MKDIIALEFAGHRTFTIPHFHVIWQRQDQAVWRCNRARMRNAALGYLATLCPSREQTLGRRCEDAALYLRMAMHYRTLAPSPRPWQTLSPA